jgi:hypothetical protein
MKLSLVFLSRHHPTVTGLIQSPIPDPIDHGGQSTQKRVFGTGFLA